MRAATMLDILAALDAAIDEIAPAATSRSCRQRVGPDPVTGSRKSLNCQAVPVLPVIPAPNRGVHEDRQGTRSRTNAQNTGGGSHAYISFFTGSTGSTGSLEDFCGVRRSRDGQTEREVAGATGSLADLDLDRLDPESPPGDVPRRRW